jgi:hypothetical protein
MRLASREKAILSQWEVGAGLVPGGGPMATAGQRASGRTSNDQPSLLNVHCQEERHDQRICRDYGTRTAQRRRGCTRSLIDFYRAFNARDLDGLAANWEPGDAPSMDNPDGRHPAWLAAVKAI